MSVYAGPKLITGGLLCSIDPGNTKSYPGTGTSMTDLTRSGRTVTVNGTPTYTSPYFTISSDTTYISMGNTDLSHGTGDFTYSIWVRFASIDSLDTLIENGSWTDTLLFRCESNTVTVYAEGALAGTFSWTRSTNVWYNVVFVRSSSTVSMYINGTLTGTPFTMTTNISLAVTALWLMRSQHSTGQFTSGDVSAFSVYNTALTASQIRQNFNALRGRFGV